MLDLSQLNCFVRIAELGSVSAAARSLNSPKSSVSRSLVRLEESIGAVLVERSTRHLRLTDAGLLLLRHARRILDDLGEAENAVGGLVGIPRGTLRVSVPFTFAAGPLGPMLPKFLEKYPELRVVLTVDNRNIDLLKEDIDVVIRIGPLPDSELVARRLASFILFPCASPAYLAAHGTPTTIADLARHRLFGHADGRPTWRFREADGKFETFDIGTCSIIPEPAVLKTMLIAGAGIGVLPDFHAQDAISDGRLVRLLPRHDAGYVDAHALYPSHRSLSAKVRVFVDALLAHLKVET